MNVTQTGITYLYTVGVLVFIASCVWLFLFDITIIYRPFQCPILSITKEKNRDMDIFAIFVRDPISLHNFIWNPLAENVYMRRNKNRKP